MTSVAIQAMLCGDGSLSSRRSVKTDGVRYLPMRLSVLAGSKQSKRDPAVALGFGATRVGM